MQNDTVSPDTSSTQDNQDNINTSQALKVDSTGQQEQHSSVLRLRGLSYACAEQDLREFFKDFEIVDIVICTRHGRTTGDAFVSLQNNAVAAGALTALNYEFLGTRYIEIFYASAVDMENAKSMSKKGYFVRLRGLPFNASGREVLKFFLPDVEVVKGIDGVVFTYSEDGRLTGEAFVELQDEDSVSKAMSKHKNRLGNRYIELFHATRTDLSNAIQRNKQILGNYRPSFWMPGSSVNRGSMIGSSVSRGSMIVPTRELQGGMGGRSYAGSSGYSVYGLQDSQYHPLMVGEGGVLTSKGGSSNMSYVPQIPFESGQLPDRYSMGPDSSQMLNRLETVRSVSQPIMMSGGNTTYSQFSYSTAGVSSTLTGRRYSGQPAEAVARSSAASSHSTQQGNTALTSSTSHLTSRRSSYSQPLPPSQSPASTRMHNPPHQPAARSSAPSFWHPRGMLSDPGQFAVQDVAALMAGMSLDRQGSHNAAAAAVGMMHPPPTGMGMPMMIFPGEYQHMGMPHDQYFAFYQQQGVAADYYAPANYYYPALMPTSNPPSARPSFSNVHNTQLTPARIAQQHYVNSPGSVPYTQTSPQGRGGQLLVRQHSSQYEGGSSRGYSSQLLRGRGNHLIRHRSSGPLEVALQVNN